jgi:tetratricopeptide (TPR) repeat protein
MATASQTPESPLVREAQRLFRRGDLPASEALFRRAIDERPDDAAALVGLARAGFLSGDERHALGLLDRAEKAAPGLVDVLVTRAVILEKGGDAARAIELSRAAARKEPRHFDARFTLARLLAKAGKWTEAAAEYEAALALDPASAVAELHLGAVLVEVGRAAEGLRHLMRGVELAPRVLEGYLALADVLVRLGEDRAAEKVLAAANSARPRHREVLERLMGIHQKRLDLAQARDLARELATIAPKDPGIWRRRALLELTSGAPLEAEKSAKKARSLAPRDPETHFALGVIYEAMKVWKPARAAYERAIEVGPKHWGALTNLGRLLATAEKPALDEAVKLQRKARALAPDEAAPALNLALALDAKGERAKAAEAARAVLALEGAPADAKAQAKRVLSRAR